VVPGKILAAACGPAGHEEPLNRDESGNFRTRSIFNKGLSFSRLFSSVERFLRERDFKGGSEKGRPRRPESSLALKPSTKDKIKNGLNTPIFLCRVDGQSLYSTGA